MLKEKKEKAKEKKWKKRIPNEGIKCDKFSFHSICSRMQNKPL